MNHEESSLSSSTDEEEENGSEGIFNGAREKMSDEAANGSPQNDLPIMDEQQSIPDLQQFETDKKAIYKHPLFPLLALLLEKCEIATQSLNTSSSNNNSTSFNSEIAAFVQHQQRDGKPFLSDDPEVDALMIKAIQVLRIHLLELEKVSELCKDFCQRYIACLRTKMNSENLLRGTTGVGGNGDGSNANSFFDGSSCSSNSSDNSESNHATFPDCSNAATNHGGSATQTVYQMVQTSQGLVAQPIQLTTGSSSQQNTTIHGSTPISQIGSNGSNNSRLPLIAPRLDSGSNDDDLSDSDNFGSSHNGKKKQQKRGVLPKQATSVMRSWLFQHIVHPYPTEDEKRAIASQTNLTLLQVNNWFINARRRILQPMLDTANALNNENNQNQGGQSGGKSGSTKKLKTSNRSNPSLQRFWPESIANAIQSGTVETSNNKLETK